MIELALALIACSLIAVSIGSNDTSNAFGISIGIGVLSFKRASMMLLFFVFAGVLLQGDEVMKTTGKLIDLNIYALGLSLMVSAFLITFSNWKKLPVSTHQVIVGSLVGAGFAFSLPIQQGTLLKIIASWVISPFGASIFSIIIFLIVGRLLKRITFINIERTLKILLLTSGILIAYNTGANELATALGPVVYFNVLGHIEASILGTVLIWLGAVLLSHRVIETVGKGITALDPRSGFSAQFGAGLCVWIFTSVGMPVSTTYCIIGGITGVGLLKGIRTVKTGLIKRIFANWFIVPAVAFLFSYVLSTTLIQFVL